MDSNAINALMKREIDLSKNAVYVVVNGSVSVLDEMFNGTDTIIWKKGIVDVERSQRIRCSDGAKNISGTLVKPDNL